MSTQLQKAARAFTAAQADFERPRGPEDRRRTLDIKNGKRAVLLAELQAADAETKARVLDMLLAAADGFMRQEIAECAAEVVQLAEEKRRADRARRAGWSEEAIEESAELAEMLNAEAAE